MCSAIGHTFADLKKKKSPALGGAFDAQHRFLHRCFCFASRKGSI